MALLPKSTFVEPSRRARRVGRGSGLNESIVPERRVPQARAGQANFDASAIGRGMSIAAEAEGRAGQELGRAVSNIGGVAQEISNKLEVQRIKQLDFETGIAFEEWKNEQLISFERLKSNTGADQIAGFSGGVGDEALKSAREFFKTVPEEVRQKYYPLVFRHENAMRNAAAKYETEQRKAISEQKIKGFKEIALTRISIAPIEDHDQIISDFEGLIDPDQFHTSAEKAEFLEDLRNRAGQAYIQTLPADKREDILRELEKAVLSGKPFKGSSALASLTFDDRQKLLKQAEGEINSDEGSLRNEVTKDGIDMMRDKTLTPEWLEANRDVLSVTNYKMFEKHVYDPGGGRQETDPRVYLELEARAEAGDDGLEEEMEAMWVNNELSQAAFFKLRGVLEDALAPEKGETYEGFLRQQLKSRLAPGNRDPDSFYSRQFDALTQFDQWVADNPDATRGDLKSITEEIVGDFRRIRYQSGVTELPLPDGVNASRETITIQDLDDAKARLQAEVARLADEGKTDRRLADQAALLRTWRRLVEVR